ncbi:hypothetical protein NY035_01670 [Corynebacterium diphtheriae bv. mitis]|uniref:Uncharacterized protein n=1 Tax=Corynebacterium diphtheriae TaxID=1717 RepID=A0A811G400_CORDP|nr:hypothetical protein [Corynebacterium diphtheriae]OWO45790.1 hypothetical protein AY545_03140 [Corynebacterium belfantii]MBG9359054.1 hypothetical protein [Corynebacterium diphtheriae bv. mitis]MBG9361102.1 hypothetical protein [Corynebacterium diphtheriae bv. mitis]MBG9363267.1 hypothetical protein [Corynebacterium diphtheriae bv. mitis]MBG9365409.1 hypothetical protein [Corynebacterium diphtheriae bv. mitis]
MPKITGKLETITRTPSAVREVWLRPPSTRPGATGLIVDEPVRVIVDESGEFTADIAPGAGVLLLIGPAGMTREAIPLLVREGTKTLRQAVEEAKDFTPDVHDRLAELANETAENLEAARSLRADTDSAAQKMREAAQALESSVKKTVKESTEGIKTGAAEVLSHIQEFQKAAKQSEDNAAKAAVGAEGSKEQAVVSASNAATSEGKAQAALEGLQAKLEAWKPQAEQLEKWKPQYLWLKENAASGFAKIAELMQDAAAGVRGELAGLVEQAKTAQATAGQHSLKAQAAAKEAESTSTRVVDAAIVKLKGNAPAMLDTLEELAERVKTGGTLETEIIQKMSKMADLETVKKLVARLDGLTIAGVQGLSAALADKAAARHKHGTTDVTGLDTELAGLKGDLEGKAPRQHGHSQRDISGLEEKLSAFDSGLRQKLDTSDFPTRLSQDAAFSTMQSKVTSVESRVSTAESSLSSMQSTTSSTSRSLEEVQQALSDKVNRNEITDMARKSDVQQLQATVNAAPKIKVVSQMPTHPDSQTIYLVR